MLSPIPLLLTGLALVVLWFVAAWWQSARRGHPHARPSAPLVGLGAVTLFFDTLGIGNYAPTTAIFRFFRLVRDEAIPATLNVGSSIPVAFEAFAFITAIAVDPLTLGLMVPVGALGGYVGAAIVSRLPRRAIQVGMALALVAGAAFMTVTNLQWLPGGGEALGFTGGTLIAATLLNFVFCGFNALGIGSYAPSLIVFSLLGMSPRAAFPIMMGSAAYGLPLAGIKYARTDKYDGRAALGLAIGGVPGVLVAAYVVKQLPLETLRWLVVVVVLYAGLSLLRTAFQRGRA